jgi:hypothetical protein
MRDIYFSGCDRASLKRISDVEVAARVLQTVSKVGRQEGKKKGALVTQSVVVCGFVQNVACTMTVTRDPQGRSQDCVA